MSHVPAFPKDFLWGSSISGGQCEGGYATRGATVVDHIPQGRGARFAWMRNPSPVLEGGQGICLNPNGTDFYGHWKEDIALLADAGVRALRFSVLWSRIFPDDREEPSAEGLAFYSNVIDELLAHDIVPVITTIHFDMPLWVALRHDGFATREGLERYERFVDAIVAAYADRVKYWISYCELNNIDFIPFVVAGVADDGSPEAAQRIKRAEWHLLLGNAYLVRACHAADPSIMVGCEFGFSPTYTLSPSPACYAQKLREDARQYRFSDVLVRGTLPKTYRAALAQAGIEPTADELALLQEHAIDFLAPSYYRSQTVDENGYAQNLSLPVTTFGWTIDPEGLRSMLNEVYARYGKPIMIVENGLGTPDVVGPDGSIQDDYRIEFLRAHIKQMRLAVGCDGVDMLGYLTWCAFDCVSTSEGLVSKRYGLIYVDVDDEGRGTYARTPKASAAWFRRVSDSNGEDLD